MWSYGTLPIAHLCWSPAPHAHTCSRLSYHLHCQQPCMVAHHCPSKQPAAAGLMIFWPVLYFTFFVTCLTKAYYFVHSAPWADFKIANLLCRLIVSPVASPCAHALILKSCL